MGNKKILLPGWGNYPVSEGEVVRPESLSQLSAVTQTHMIARGLGRSYGDAAVNSAGETLLTERLNHFLLFDESRGILHGEAGLSLAEIHAVTIPKGWFLPVTPGTQHVTLGGCVAADVHGKNHHCDGGFGDHVCHLKMILADGSTVVCSREENSELFYATLGGMGLTGIITEVVIALIPITSSQMEVVHTPATDLDSLLSTLKASESSKYSVAWIDCLASGKHFGRGIVMSGKHASCIDTPLKATTQHPLSIPFYLPEWVLNRWSMRAFNQCYYLKQNRDPTPFLINYQSYFYPLDILAHWNRCYGKKGFIQYQFVIPSEGAAIGLYAILKEFTKAQCGSFLAVLKKFGEAGPGILSFPMKGYTLALDIPIRNEKVFPFLDKLDEKVLKYGGRVYLAKDARLKPEQFRQMYPRFNEWLKIKKQVDPKGRFCSDLSRRLHMEKL